MTLFWFFPAIDCLYKEKPYRYISHLIGHESKVKPFCFAILAVCFCSTLTKIGLRFVLIKGKRLGHIFNCRPVSVTVRFLDYIL